MKFLPLVWKNIWRRKFRTIFTLLSIFIAFVLFGILMTIRQSFTFGVEIAGADRLVLIHKVSLIMPLPVSYKARLQQTKGVELATHQTWFGGIYQDPANFFANMAVEPDVFLKMYPEFVLPPEQVEAWRNDRQGAIVGRDSAERFGWKIGDHVPLTAPIWLPKGGGTTWEFNIVGIYDGGDAVDKTQMFFRYDYLDENRAQGQGQVGWYVVKISDPAQAVDLSHTFDEMFANSVRRNEDDHRKGVRRGVREADRRYRQHHDRDLVDGAVHVRSRCGEHDGAVGARAHQRAGSAEDAGVFRPGDSDARSCRVALHCASPAGCSAWAWRGSSSQLSAIRPTACCRFSCCLRAIF